MRHKQVTRHLWEVLDASGALAGYVRRVMSGPDVAYLAIRPGEPAPTAPRAATFADAVALLGAPPAVEDDRPTVEPAPSERDRVPGSFGSRWAALEID